MNRSVLPKRQRDLWEKLAGIESVSDFYLAGGTAVALHLEHRESIDFDFFSESASPSPQLIEDLKGIGKLRIDSESERTFLGILSGVKISFFHYRYPCLADPTLIDGIRVLSLEDLVAMKIVAIGQRGTRKDFIDLHTILKSGWNFEAIFSAVERKFRDVEYNKAHLLKSLTYFEDADQDPMPKMLKPIEWSTIRTDLEDIVRRFFL